MKCDSWGKQLHILHADIFTRKGSSDSHLIRGLGEGRHHRYDYDEDEDGQTDRDPELLLHQRRHKTAD